MNVSLSPTGKLRFFRFKWIRRLGMALIFLITLFFLIHAVERLTARGGRLVNVDVTLICERPKVKPHRQAMRERLAELLSLPLDAVSVKATTTEAMGFTGRGEGLAAQALATIELTVS